LTVDIDRPRGVQPVGGHRGDLAVPSHGPEVGERLDPRGWHARGAHRDDGFRDGTVHTLDLDAGDLGEDVDLVAGREQFWSSQLVDLA
jgi:hypothetical protein